MNTCDNCKHWQKKSSFEGDHQWCNNFGECALLAIAEGDKPAADDKLVLIPDYGESVLTGPKFGCVHHEPKS